MCGPSSSFSTAARSGGRWSVTISQIKIDGEVRVRGDIAKAVDLPPRDISVPILELRGELGVREDFEPPKDRVLNLSLLEEHRTSAADVLVDQLGPLGDVFDVASLALAASSAVASRRICSAARSCLVSSFTST